MDNELEFLNSRYDFVGRLLEQTSVNTGKSLFDEKGTLARAALNGIAKSEIEEILNKNSFYKQQLELMQNTSLVTDPIEKAKILEFKDFYNSLQAMQDPESKVSLRDILRDEISSKYPDADDALFDIENGAGPKEIFASLDSSSAWKQDAQDFITKDYVDLPSRTQRTKWSQFGELINLINDLKYVN